MGKNKGQPKPVSRTKRWGQFFLLMTAILNGAVFALGLFLASRQEDLDDKVTDEMYFMRNDQAVSGEIVKRTLMHASLNELKLLRRLARERVSAQENKMLLSDETVFQKEINASLRKIAGVAYLQAHDPPKGQNPEAMLSSMSDDELYDKLPQWQNEAFRFAKGLKTEMNAIRARLGFWKVVNSALLSFSTLFLVIGSYLVFKAEGDEAPAS